ncbi:MAG: hypothetical protein IJU83_03960, partial [Clostridia bacterium]|nr:hypothetical protein [Clostridia bacterium]
MSDEQMEMSPQEQSKQRRLARRAKRNARIARGRFWKNLFIWLLGVLFVPTVLVAVSFLVPLSTIVGSDGQYISEDLSKKSLFEVTKTVATNYGEFGFADFPVIAKTLSDLESTDIGDGKTLGDIVKFDTDKLNAIKFGSSNIGDEVRGCVEVIASLDSIGGTDLLGDLGGLSVFNDYDEAGTVETVNVSPKPADFNAKMYYYKTSDVGVSAYSTESAGYKRAFDNDGNLVAEIAALSESDRNSLKLYYPALKDVAFGDLVDIVSDSFDRVTVKSLLTSFGADNDMLLDILGEDTTVKGIKDFDFNTVKLCKVLDAPTTENGMKNEKLYDILREATGKATNDEITIEALSSFNTDAVKLTSVLAYGTTTEKLYDVLCDATGKATAGDISLSDLNNFETDNIKLTSVLAYGTTTEKLYDILCDATGKATAGEIVLSDLDGFETDDIKLSSVLENNAANAKLYDILEDLTNKGADEITINDLSGLNTDNIHLITVLAESGNEKLYDIMRDATGAATNGAITIASLSSFDADNIHLITVLAESGNEKLYDIMRDATGAATNGAI